MLKLQFRPPSRMDPDFGRMVFMFLSNAPERSYWECEWKLPKTGTTVAIAVPGTEEGPSAAGRQFYLGFPDRFDEVLAAVRPKLEEVFRTWLQKDLPADIFSAVEFTGFDVEDLGQRPVNWDVSFETTGEQWLGITIPFIDGVPQDAIVDT